MGLGRALCLRFPICVDCLELSQTHDRSQLTSQSQDKPSCKHRRRKFESLDCIPSPMKKSTVRGHATVTMNRLWGLIGGLFGFACLVGSQLTTTSIVTTTADFNCSSVNTTECTVCPAGTYPDNDTEFCLCCSSGACVNSLYCSPCQSGYYQPHSGQADCLPCPQGFYSNTSKSEVCQSCQPGSFSNANASVLCTPCEKGFFSSIQNATQCQPCTPGSFCNTSSCTSCAPCPAGEEAVNGGSADCTPCSPGMYKGPKDPKCLHCRDGEYQVESGADKCNLCPIDHYCPSPDISPITCPEDAFCPAGSTEPSYCMETFLRKSGDSCALAPLTIVLLVVCAAVLLFAVIYVVRKNRKAAQRQPMTAFTPKSPLLQPRLSSSVYGLDYDAEPVYAGW